MSCITSILSSHHFLGLPLDHAVRYNCDVTLLWALRRSKYWT